ncbi:RDD family protein [Williamsia deligens]|uniref:RDD family protein n=1 Tax=Williamsia deligens TaxID=321325 RepID=A0ABW3G6N1_9NOCA|nr:RDD family protein [Williamsia deligens]MCP2193470.1 putative membrane protein YckC, RDD family [Williamsia deligens]
MTGPQQYPGQNPEGQDPGYGQSPQYGQTPQYGQAPQYGQGPDLGKGGQQASYPPPGAYPPPQGSYPPPAQGNYPPPPPGQYGAPNEQGIYSTSGQPAGAGLRLVARILDGLIVGIPVAIIEGIAAAVGGWVVGYIVALILSLAGFAYFVLLESRNGATLGKRIMSLRTVGPDGGLPTQDVAIRRNAFMLLGFVSALLNFTFILSGLVGLVTLAVFIALGVTIANDQNKQGFHDKFAGGTRVIRA